MSAPRQAHDDLAIGIIGPHDLVERIMLSGFPAAQRGGGPAAGGQGPARRLVAAAYRQEQEAADKVTWLGTAIDSCLFASRVPYEHARRAGVLGVPGAYIQLSGSVLYGALLRASRDDGCDVARSSIDTLSRADVDDAFGEVGIASFDVHVCEEPGGPAALASFHERLWRRDATSVAFTCLQSVAIRLSAAGVPVFILRPTSSAIRSALHTAALLGGNRRLEDAQLAVVIVEVPTLRDSLRRALPRQSREEIRLTVHRFLIQEAQGIQAAVSPLGEHAFLITATRGSLAGLMAGTAGPPFAGRARSELGISVEVGVGTGRTALDAEAHARAALDRSERGSAGPGASVHAAGPGASVHAAARSLVPGPRGAAAARTGRTGLDTLTRLAGQLPPSGTAPAIDAETAGQLLNVTTRTARRLLHSLVEDGLAWPLPPTRTPQPGRPRQLYRLVVERLERSPAR
jgi:hypothetical protein